MNDTQKVTQLRLRRVVPLSVTRTEVALRVDLSDGSRRVATVRVGSGRTWFEAVRFPHLGTAEGESFGDPAIDEAVRDTAAGWLVLATAAGTFAGERRWAA